MSRGSYRVPHGDIQRSIANAKALAVTAEDIGAIAIGENSTPRRREEEKAPQQQSVWSRLLTQLGGSRTITGKSEADAQPDSGGGSASVPSSTLTSGSVEPPTPSGPTFRVIVPPSMNYIIQMNNSGSPSASQVEVVTRMPEPVSKTNLPVGGAVTDRSNFYNWLWRMVKLVDADDDMFVTDPSQLRQWREWLALVATERPAARDRALDLRGADAAMFISTAHECLAMPAGPADSATHGAILRLLQDVCSTSGELPINYWLTDITVNYRDCIGRGGEALVYMGTYKGWKVVVRQVSPLHKKEWNSPLGQKTFKLLQREIVTHSQLRHKNIIPLLGVFRESQNEPPMMILPFMEQGSASDYLDRLVNMLENKHDLAPMVYRIMRHVTKALAYLHTRDPPVLHGDLHPGNILIDSTGNAVLCDFGFSRIRHEITRTRTDIREGGRGRFLAPELSSGPDAFRTSQASDVYSLAMTFLALGTMNPPFQDYPRELEAMHAARQGIRPDRPQSLLFPNEYVDELWSLMEEMWVHEPADRPSTLQVKGRMPHPFIRALLVPP